jgi:hypothetical protein
MKPRRSGRALKLRNLSYRTSGIRSVLSLVLCSSLIFVFVRVASNTRRGPVARAPCFKTGDGRKTRSPQRPACTSDSREGIRAAERERIKRGDRPNVNNLISINCHVYLYLLLRWPTQTNPVLPSCSKTRPSRRRHRNFVLGSRRVPMKSSSTRSARLLFPLSMAILRFCSRFNRNLYRN